jgi:antitoxin (DNA-binding transcriptional repressor) of toxin-antitoxin stability system
MMRVYTRGMKKPVIHLSEAEAAATNFTTLLARVYAGTEIIIENGKRPVAIFRAVEPARRTIFECIELLPEDSTATIDSDFSKDVRAAVESQSEPLNPPAWD